MNMVKVISEEKLVCKCPKCHSLLEANYIDFYTVQERINEFKKYINCPICKYKIEEFYWKSKKD